MLPGVPFDAWEEDNDKTGIREHKREGYQRLKAELRAGKHSHVVFFMLERMSRDDTGMINFVRSLWDQGIEVHDTQRGKITDSNLTLLATFARMEVDANSKRSMSKQRALAEANYKLGRPPLGYRWVMAATYTDDDGKVHIKTDHGRTEYDDCADVMREVFLRAADPKIPLRQTRHWMNEQLGLKKDVTDFNRILSNPYYMGLNINLRENCYCFNPDNEYGSATRFARESTEWVRREHPNPICSEETFAAIQRRLARNKTVGRTVEHPRNPLSGFLHCAHCARRLSPHYPHPGRLHYRCRVCVPQFARSDKKIKAGLAMVLAEAVDVSSHPDVVVMTRLTTAETARRTMEQQVEADKARLKQLSRERGNATRNLNAGIISPADYAASITLVEEEQDEVRARILKVERALVNMGRGPQLGALAQYVQQVRDWCAPTAKGAASTIDVAEVRTALQYIVDKITVDGDAETMTITFSPDMAVLMGKAEVTVPCTRGGRGKADV
jgi:hypothetical protein